MPFVLMGSFAASAGSKSQNKRVFLSLQATSGNSFLTQYRAPIHLRDPFQQLGWKLGPAQVSPASSNNRVSPRSLGLTSSRPARGELLAHRFWRQDIIVET